VTKVAQSATATWWIWCHINILVGPKTFFKQKFFLQGCFSKLI